MIRLLLVLAMLLTASGCEYILTQPGGGGGNSPQRIDVPVPKLP